MSQWLDWAVQEFNLDSVEKNEFKLNGADLCALSKEDFTCKAPPYTGDVLHSHLSLLRARNCKLRINTVEVLFPLFNFP